MYDDNGFTIPNPETKIYYRSEKNRRGCDSIITALYLTVLYDTLAFLEDIIVEGNDGELSLIPEFNDTVYNYFVMLSCPPVRQEISISAIKGRGVYVIYLGEARQDGTLTIHERDAGDHKAVIAVQKLDSSRIYTITFRQRLPDTILQHLWDDMMIVNLNPNNNGGYNFTGFQWYLDSIAIPGETNRYMLQDALLNGSYYHTILKTATGKTLETCPYLYTEPNDQLRLYPNPVYEGDILTLEMDMSKATEVQLYDIHGRLLKTYTVKENQHILRIPVTLNEGMYMLKIGHKIQKFIVVK
jgi:hypothetical protein